MNVLTRVAKRQRAATTPRSDSMHSLACANKWIANPCPHPCAQNTKPLGTTALLWHARCCVMPAFASCDHIHEHGAEATASWVKGKGTPFGCTSAAMRSPPSKACDLRAPAGLV
eukprot:360783-Chlamydomonas_euryale.AAC.3